MTLIANIKGYINGNDWGIFAGLLTFQEIVDSISGGVYKPQGWYGSAVNGGIPTNINDVTTELNKDPSGYFTSLSNESKIVSDWTGGVGTGDHLYNVLFAIMDDNEPAPEFRIKGIYYDSNDDEWKYIEATWSH